QLVALVPSQGVLHYKRGACRARLDEEQYELDDDWVEDEAVQKERLLAAAADFEQAIALGFVDDDVFSDLYNVHCQLQDMDAARAALDRGIAAQPDSAFLHYLRHSFCLSRHDQEGAAADRARAEALGFRFND